MGGAPIRSLAALCWLCSACGGSGDAADDQPRQPTTAESAAAADDAEDEVIRSDCADTNLSPALACLTIQGRSFISAAPRGPAGELWTLSLVSTDQFDWQSTDLRSGTYSCWRGEITAASGDDTFMGHFDPETAVLMWDGIEYTFAEPDERPVQSGCSGSWELACLEIQGVSFVSVAPQPPENEHWIISLISTDQFEWQSTVFRSGSYFCTAGRITAAGGGETFSAHYDPATAILLWEGIEYR